MSESVRHKWRHGYSLVHSLFSSLKRKCANFKRFVTHVISIPVHSFYLHHSSHNISFKNREQKIRSWNINLKAGTKHSGWFCRGSKRHSLYSPLYKWEGNWDELTFAGTWKTNGQIADRLDFRTFAVKRCYPSKSDEVIKVALHYKRDESTENKSDCLQQGIPVGRKIKMYFQFSHKIVKCVFGNWKVKSVSF